MKSVIKLTDEDTIDLVLPDGRVVNIEYYQTDEESLPELDIGLPCDMVANCWAEHLKPAPKLKGCQGHVRVVRQIVIPVEKTAEQAIKDRLEYLRAEIEAERISQDEILELESLAEHIDPGDVLLLEWAGVPENHDVIDGATAYKLD